MARDLHPLQAPNAAGGRTQKPSRCAHQHTGWGCCCDKPRHLKGPPTGSIVHVCSKQRPRPRGTGRELHQWKQGFHVKRRALPDRLLFARLLFAPGGNGNPLGQVLHPRSQSQFRSTRETGPTRHDSVSPRVSKLTISSHGSHKAL